MMMVTKWSRTDDLYSCYLPLVGSLYSNIGLYYCMWLNIQFPKPAGAGRSLNIRDVIYPHIVNVRYIRHETPHNLCENQQNPRFFILSHQQEHAGQRATLVPSCGGGAVLFKLKRLYVHTFVHASQKMFRLMFHKLQKSVIRQSRQIRLKKRQRFSPASHLHLPFTIKILDLGAGIA